MSQPQPEYLERIATGTGSAHVVCFPHAGGSASWYRTWADAAHNEGVTLDAIRYPGHQGLLSRPWATSIPHLAALIAPQLEQESREIILFGHSMGALVAFEVALLASQRGIRYKGLHFSGSRAPSIPLAVCKSHYNDSDLIEAVGDLAPETPNALTHPEIADLFLPIVRHDFRIAENYQSSASLGHRDIVIHAGIQDREFAPREAFHWENHTQGQIAIKHYEGGHFFLQDKGSEIIPSLITR